MTTPAMIELRNRIHANVVRAQQEFGADRADRITEAVMAMFYKVGDEWESIDISTMQDGPGGRYLDQRWLVARIATNDTRERNMVPDRSVSP